MRNITLHLLACLFLWLTPEWLEARPRIDVIHLKNGDRLTCEIKGLAQGQLTVKTDYTVGTFVIDWDEVETFESPQAFQVETQAGIILVGTLEKKQADSPISIIADGVSQQVPQSDIIWLRQEQSGALGKMDLTVDYGFNFAQANSTVSSNLAVSADYVTKLWNIYNDSNFVFNGQADADDSSREQINNGIRRRLRWEHWFAAGLVNFLSNSTQELDLRTTLGGGVGREFVHTNKTRVSGLVGGSYSHETYSQDSGQTNGNNGELLLQLTYSWFSFDFSGFDFDVLVHPSLTDLGRIRLDLNTSYSLIVLGDNLQWKISFYDNYDSRPPTDVAKNDSGISTSLGWKFF